MGEHNIYNIIYAYIVYMYYQKFLTFLVRSLTFGPVPDWEELHR